MPSIKSVNFAEKLTVRRRGENKKRRGKGKKTTRLVEFTNDAEDVCHPATTVIN
jgi:hypothetical protein